MSGSTILLLQRFYNEATSHPLTPKAYCNLTNVDGYFSRQMYDTKLVTVLKNVAYKTSMLTLAVLAPIEWIARSSLALVAYSLSLISTPIEWAVRTPVSLFYYKELPSISISRKIYQLAYDLSNYNLGSIDIFGCALHNFLFYRNHLAEGLLG
jgi:hypothetical protein